VIPEVVNQVAYEVIGNDLTITMASEAGQLQLNAFEPVIASSILQSLAWMTNSFRTLRVNCVDGITANRDRLAAMVASSVGVITALIPVIGYEEAAKLAKTALATGTPIRELVVNAGLMSAEEVDAALAPDKLSNASS
jgi:aspartate ammonia-lyase